MLSIALLVVTSLSQNTDIRAGYGVAIDSATSFCLMMPAKYGARIADYDSTGVSQCWNNPSGALGTSAMPAGFITAAHFIETPYYKQVTGTYNSAAYGLDPTDSGTQWDNSLASQGGVEPWSGCAGTPQYLEFLGDGVFCLRCCKFAFSAYCNPSDDTQGCYTGIPGDFNAGFSNTFTNTVAPSVPVINYNDCSTTTDTCKTSGFVCCNSQGDASAGLPNKGTCQPPPNCKNQLPPQQVTNVAGGSATLAVSVAPITVSVSASVSVSVSVTSYQKTTTTAAAASSTGAAASSNGATKNGLQILYEIAAVLLGLTVL